MGCRGRAAWRCWPALAGQMTVEACHGRAQEGKQGREIEDREKREREREREKGLRLILKLTFFRILYGNSRNFEYESCR